MLQSPFWNGVFKETVLIFFIENIYLSVCDTFLRLSRLKRESRNFLSLFVRYRAGNELTYPSSLFQKDVAEAGFDDIGTLAKCIEGNDGKRRQMRDDESCGQYDDPHIYAVKKKRDHDLTAGTKCEIRRVREGAEGHCDPACLSADIRHRPGCGPIFLLLPPGTDQIPGCQMRAY